MTITGKQRKKFSFIDVFSGPGGLSIGFKLSGFFEPVTAVEMSSIASKTYEQNLGIPVLNENLARIQPVDLIERAYKGGFKKIDVIIGGPPCKAFTTANRGSTKWEKVKERLLKEEKVVENIEWFSYWKMIEGIKPQAFIAENVMGLRTRRDVLENFLNRVASINYNAKICELDAQYFGVPQRRKRIFIIGIRNPRRNKNEAGHGAGNRACKRVRGSLCICPDWDRLNECVGKENLNGVVLFFKAALDAERFPWAFLFILTRSRGCTCPGC